jgi:predicted esterase
MDRATAGWIFLWAEGSRYLRGATDFNFNSGVRDVEALLRSVCERSKGMGFSNDALGLDRPMICGFSDGAMTATVVGFRHPGSVRAIVNHAGYDTLDPQAPSMPMMHQNLGGGPACDPGGPGRTRTC